VRTGLREGPAASQENDSQHRHEDQTTQAPMYQLASLNAGGGAAVALSGAPWHTSSIDIVGAYRAGALIVSEASERLSQAGKPLRQANPRPVGTR
jgi:hypothetical protein